MGAVWYASVEDVMHASDVQESARTAARIGRALGAATDQIDSVLLHHFYPTVGTKYVDFPNWQYAYPWRLWLDGDNEIVSLASVTSGGVTVDPASVLLEPVNSGPPYDRVEINIGTSSSWESGATHQRAVALTGVFGFAADTDPADALAAVVSSTSATSINVTNSSRITGIGTGQLIQVDDERMVVTRRSMLTSGQTLQTPITAVKNAVTVAVTDGTKFFEDETILLDAERMLIVDIAGNNLLVRRATDGTVLAAHSGSTVYAPRTLTVTRGVLGTTAATHADTTAIVKNRPPELVKTLAIALALNTIQAEAASYGRAYSPTVGAGPKPRPGGESGLAELWAQAVGAFGTQSRVEAV